MPSTDRPSTGRATPSVAGKSRRLPADLRRRSILEAARRAFSETGDVKGTTIKAIAAHSGVSGAMIYQLFDSKGQLFFEAVVAPLRDAVDDLLAAAETVDRDEPLTPERRMQTLRGLYRQLVSTLEEVVPLLGLVLFGDPAPARRFYREDLAVAMERLGAAWREVEDRQGRKLEHPGMTARAVMGTALMLALEHHYTEGFDLHVAVAKVSEGSINGFLQRPATTFEI